MKKRLLAFVLAAPLLIMCAGRTETANRSAPSRASTLVADARTAGLYAPETTPDGITFRWTNGNAVIEGPVQAPAAQAVRLTVYSIEPTKIRVTVDGETVADRTVPGGIVDVGGVLKHPSRKPVARIESAAFVPAGGRRRLGVQLRALSYITDVSQIDLASDPISPATLRGVYPIENDASRRFRWTNGDATISLPVSVHGPLTLRLGSLDATNVTVSVDGARTQTMRVYGTAHTTIALRPGPNVIRIVSPSFTPPPVNGYTRTLGVQITDIRTTPR